MHGQHTAVLSDLAHAGDQHGYRVALSVAALQQPPRTNGVVRAAGAARYLQAMLVPVAAAVWLYDLSLFLR